MWVFGYGSLLWNPGFRYSKREIARLDGYRRSFSMRSIHHRGTVENPGLVLALSTDRQSFCEGLAFEVEQGKEVETLDYLRRRELVSSAYLERKVSLHLKNGQSIQSLVYIIDEGHAQYCKLTLDEQAKIIAHKKGGEDPMMNICIAHETR
mgnify:CR=1 FL=1